MSATIVPNGNRARCCRSKRPGLRPDRALGDQSMSTKETDDDSSSVSCPWDGCDYTSIAPNGVAVHHAKKHGESIAGVEVTCAWCDNPKRVKRNVAEKDKRHFCDQQCMGKWRSENRTGENAANWRGGNHTYHCEYCGGERELRPCQVTESGRVFCNRKCKAEWESENWTDETHPAWTGGRVRYGKGWSEPYKEYIRKQYGHACVICGVSEKTNGRKLDVHHIQPARSFEDGDEMRHHPSNLIVLCRSCHKRWEGIPLRPQVV